MTPIELGGGVGLVSRQRLSWLWLRAVHGLQCTKNAGKASTVVARCCLRE